MTKSKKPAQFPVEKIPCPAPGCNKIGAPETIRKHVKACFGDGRHFPRPPGRPRKEKVVVQAKTKSSEKVQCEKKFIPYT